MPGPDVNFRIAAGGLNQAKVWRRRQPAVSVEIIDMWSFYWALKPKCIIGFEKESGKVF
jgi:hypothetical protein